MGGFLHDIGNPGRGWREDKGTESLHCCTRMSSGLRYGFQIAETTCMFH